MTVICKNSRSGGTERGYDGGKKIDGCKRHIVVDTMGLLLVVAVHAANIHDSQAALIVIKQLEYGFGRLIKIIADVGYRGELAGQLKYIFR